MSQHDHNQFTLSPGDLFPDRKPVEVPLPLPAMDFAEDKPVELPQQIEVFDDSLDGYDDTVTLGATAPVLAPKTGHPGASDQAVVLHTRVVTGCGGGPDKTIFRSPRFVDQSRYKMAAAYMYPEADPGMCIVRDNAKEQGCPLYEISESGALDRHAISAMIDLCKEMKVDIWHGHDYKSNTLGLLVKRHHPMKLVTTAHGFTRETWRTKLYYHLDNLAMLGYDHVVAVSPEAGQTLRQPRHQPKPTFVYPKRDRRHRVHPHTKHRPGQTRGRPADRSFRHRRDRPAEHRERRRPRDPHATQPPGYPA